MKCMGGVGMAGGEANVGSSGNFPLNLRKGMFPKDEDFRLIG